MEKTAFDLGVEDAMQMVKEALSPELVGRTMGKRMANAVTAAGLKGKKAIQSSVGENIAKSVSQRSVYKNWAARAGSKARNRASSAAQQAAKKAVGIS